jgi:hypothetical protein
VPNLGAAPGARIVADMVKACLAGAAVVVLVAFVLLFGGCATTGRPPACNPIMERCNEADYPPLTAMLPPWPFPRLLVPLPEGDRK